MPGKNPQVLLVCAGIASVEVRVSIDNIPSFMSLSAVIHTDVIPAKEAVAKSIKALNHKDTKEGFFCLPGVAQISPEKAVCLRVFVVPFWVFCDTLKESVANGLEKKGSTKVQVCHESRVGLLVTAIEMEAGPPVAVSGSSQQICTRESQGSVKRLRSDIASGED